MNIKFVIYENVILILFLMKCHIYLLIHGFYYLIFKKKINLSQLIVKSNIYFLPLSKNLNNLNMKKIQKFENFQQGPTNISLII
jgi:hypothetical protein